MSGLLLHGYLRSIDAAGDIAAPALDIVIAGEPIERGSKLEAAQLRMVAFPKPYAPPGSFQRIQEAVGRTALTDVALGEAVTETRLARRRAGPVASLVPEGLRAFAVPTSLPSGTVVEGDRVDVLATYASGQPHTETVVEEVEVLHVLTASGRPADRAQEDTGFGMAATTGADSLTLVVLVSPDLQERLAFARAFADLAVSIAPAMTTETQTGDPARRV